MGIFLTWRCFHTLSPCSLKPLQLWSSPDHAINQPFILLFHWVNNLCDPRLHFLGSESLSGIIILDDFSVHHGILVTAWLQVPPLWWSCSYLRSVPQSSFKLIISIIAISVTSTEMGWFKVSPCCPLQRPSKNTYLLTGMKPLRFILHQQKM